MPAFRTIDTRRRKAETEVLMILGGNATLYVSDMDAAVRFYTETLGMRLRFRAANHWAEVEAGSGFVVGLHPSRRGRSPGSPGAVQIGLRVQAPLEGVVAELGRKGVKVAPIADAGPGLRFADVIDMDGNELYLWEDASALRKRSANGRRTKAAQPTKPATTARTTKATRPARKPSARRR